MKRVWLKAQSTRRTGQKYLAHVCACGVRGEEPADEGSHWFQPQNLGRAVRDAVGEMCPNPAPATEKGPGNGAFLFERPEARRRAGSRGRGGSLLPRPTAREMGPPRSDQLDRRSAFGLRTRPEVGEKLDRSRCSITEPAAGEVSLQPR